MSMTHLKEYLLLDAVIVCEPGNYGTLRGVASALNIHYQA